MPERELLACGGLQAVERLAKRLTGTTLAQTNGSGAGIEPELREAVVHSGVGPLLSGRELDVREGRDDLPSDDLCRAVGLE